MLHLFSNNEWQPTYAPFHTGTIREAAYDKTVVTVVYRSGVADDQKNVQGGVTLKRSGSAQTGAPGNDKDSRGYGAEGIAGATEAEVGYAVTSNNADKIKTEVSQDARDAKLIRQKAHTSRARVAITKLLANLRRDERSGEENSGARRERFDEADRKNGPDP